MHSTTEMLSVQVSKKSMRQLHLIWNTAAHMLTKTSKVDHITPTVRSFYQLPVRHRADFETRPLVCRALNGSGPK